ncbi:uncharacterized protein [Dermacentor andersoni]|uniref:uncharacterized protein n=1 Tax=Dermacentor andersoni TaxID=34620 RepID=UPI002415C752|nr:uncharacterized protein LOC126524498 [Dermacentor andersoni]
MARKLFLKCKNLSSYNTRYTMLSVISMAKKSNIEACPGGDPYFKTLSVLGMDTSSSLIRVLLFIVAGPCTMKCSYAGILQCQRLVPPDITSALTPCRFPCIIKYIRERFNVIMQSEPDGTPCRHMGHCSGGACLDIGNYDAPEHFQWEPSSGMTSYHNINTNGDNYAGSPAVSTSGGYARYGFLSEAKVNPYTDEVVSENGKKSGAPLFARELSARSALQHLLRMKRAAGRSEEGGRDGIELSGSGKYISLSRVKRRTKKRRRNRKGGRPQNNYNDNTYFNGNMHGAGSGVYGSPYGTGYPSVVVVDARRKKKKSSTALKMLAGGMAAGGAGLVTYKLLDRGNKHKDSGSSGAEGPDAKSSPPNKPDVEGKAAGAEGTETGNTGETETGKPEGTGGGENGAKKSEGAEASATPTAKSTGTDVTETVGTDQAQNTNSSKTDASEGARTDTTDVTKSAATIVAVNGQVTGTNVNAKTETTTTGPAVSAGSGTTEKNTDKGGSSSALPTAPVHTDVRAGSKVSVRVDATGVHIDVDKGNEGSRF